MKVGRIKERMLSYSEDKRICIVVGYFFVTMNVSVLPWANGVNLVGFPSNGIIEQIIATYFMISIIDDGYIPVTKEKKWDSY